MPKMYEAPGNAGWGVENIGFEDLKRIKSSVAGSERFSQTGMRIPQMLAWDLDMSQGARVGRIGSRIGNLEPRGDSSDCRRDSGH